MGVGVDVGGLCTIVCLFVCLFVCVCAREFLQGLRFNNELSDGMPECALSAICNIMVCMCVCVCVCV